MTKLEKIERENLNVGDVVTIINLRNGKVREGVRVTYLFPSTDTGIRYTRDPEDIYGTVIGSTEIDGSLLYRHNSNPANWPPKEGELWRDKNGKPWFAYSSAYEADNILMIGAPCEIHSAAKLLELHPELHRVYS